ncbi:hypothetical protein Tco_0970441 [Tanacetum coccineum]
MSQRMISKMLKKKLEVDHESSQAIELLRFIRSQVIFDEKKLEILRKFHWMILGGRFNQLSHVSSPLLSKPGEY